MSKEEITLKTNCNGPESITAPEVGPAGELVGGTFVSSQDGRGIRLRNIDQYLRFPASVINPVAGRIEFDYYPIHHSNAPIYRPLISIDDQYYNAIFTCVNKDWGGLEFSIQSDSTEYTYVASTSGVSLWTPNRKQRLRIEWDSTDKVDSLRIFLNDVRIDVEPRVPGGWTMVPFSENAQLYVGSRDAGNDNFCEGAIDNISVTRIVQELPPPPPPPPPPPDPEPEPAPVPSFPNDGSLMGTNIEFIRYWSQHWMYYDSFKFAGVITGNDGNPRGWANAVTTDTRPLPLDANGWVTVLQAGQQAQTLFPSHEGGEMVLEYDGEGTIDILGGTTNIQRQPGTIRFTAPRDRQLGLRITATNPSNYVRNITADAEGFHHIFKERLEPFKVLRVKDIIDTDYTSNGSWAARKLPGQHPYGNFTGVPYEDAIELCNQLHANMWINFPHVADEEYAREMGALVSSLLDKDLFVYLEYSNEVWNGQFASSRYAADQGMAQNLSTDRNVARLFYQTKRSIELMTEFNKNFDRNRTVRVLAAQLGAAWSHDQMLKMQINGGNAALNFDAFAIAPYFGPGSNVSYEATIIGRGMTELLNDVENILMPAALANAARSKAAVDVYKLPLIAYEGGQSLVPTPGNRGNQALQDLYHGANRHPRMYDIYQKFLDGWKALGGGMFVHLNYCAPFDQYGSFPILEQQDQDLLTAHKYRSIVEWIEKNKVK